MKNAILIAVSAVSIGASLAQAHYGQRVWVDVDAAGKILTFEGPPGDRPNPGNTNPYRPAEFSPSRVFTRDMGALGDIAPDVNDSGNDDDGVNYATQFPGYEATPFPTASFTGTFQLDIVGEVKYFKPATQTFVPVSQAFAGLSVPFFTVGDESTFGTSPSNNSIVAASRAFTAGSHFHPQNVLNYPNMSDANDAYDGIYELGLRLHRDGLTPSDPFFFVFGKNATLQQLQVADAAANAALVPEPASLAALGIVGLFLGRRRRAR